jgi:large subunit ribosomal protein L15
MPLTRRVPKRGFTNPFRVESQIVRLDALAELPEGAEVTTETLVAAGIIRESKGPAKLLATGTLTRAVTVRGIKLSAGARERILAAGGKVEE